MVEFFSILSSPWTIVLVIFSLLYIFKNRIMNWFVRSLMVALHHEQKRRRPKRIILVRHGNSEANNNYDILQRIPDNQISLSEKGIEQAKEAGKRLKKLLKNESIQFYVSPYKRTRQTYEYILESLKDNYSDVVYHSAIREQEYGNLQSDMAKQFEDQKKVGVFFYRFKDGESGSDVHARISIFLQYLFRRILSIDYYAWDNIIIVSHELTIKFFMMNFLDLPVKEYDNMRRLKNAEYWIIEKNKFGKYLVNKDEIFIKKEENN